MLFEAAPHLSNSRDASFDRSSGGSYEAVRDSFREDSHENRRGKRRPASGPSVPDFFDDSRVSDFKRQHT